MSMVYSELKQHVYLCVSEYHKVCDKCLPLVPPPLSCRIVQHYRDTAYSVYAQTELYIYWKHLVTNREPSPCT